MSIWKPAATLGLAAITVIASGSAFAQRAEKDRSVGEHAEDAVKTPLKDVGLEKNEIPEKLLAIQDDPYSLTGLSRCAAIIKEVRALDEVLAPDVNETVDKSKAEKREEVAGRTAGGFLGGMIPFRGLVREISGAAGDERKYNSAAYAGVARRSFLKGVGLKQGCKAPARP